LLFTNSLPAQELNVLWSTAAGAAAQTTSQRCGSWARGKHFISFSADVKGLGQKTVMDWAELLQSLRHYLMLWVGIRAAE